MNQDPNQMVPQAQMPQAPEPIQYTKPNHMMRNIMIAVSIVLFLLAAGITVLALTGSDKPAPAKNQAAEATVEPEASDTDAPSTAAMAMVDVESAGFNPDGLAVTPGTTVTWKNTDTKKHTLSAEVLGGDNALDPGATFNYTFDQPGDYTIKDGTQSMTVTVRE